MNAALQALGRRIRTLLSRGVVALVNDALKIQQLQLTVLDGETVVAQRLQNYGFTSVPLAGAEAVLAAIAGARSHLVVVATDDGRYRLKGLQNGEVAIYTDEGDSIVMKRGHLVEVTTQTLHVTAQTKVRFDTPRMELSGDFAGEGEVADKVRAMSGDRDIYNGHDHPETGVKTQPPEQQQ